MTSLPTSHRATPHGADFDGAADGGGTDACGATVSVNYFYSPRYHKGSDFEHYANEPFYAAFLGGASRAAAGVSGTSGTARAASAAAAAARDDEHADESNEHAPAVIIHDDEQLIHVAHPRRWRRLRENADPRR